jgi:hypothetical protein
MMTSRVARRASIATIPQERLAETSLPIRPIISNNPFHDKVRFNTVQNGVIIQYSIDGGGGGGDNVGRGFIYPHLYIP